MNRLLLVSILLCSTTLPYALPDTAVWYGTIKFPTDVAITEPVKIFYKGTRIPTEIEPESHQVSFAISEHISCTDFFIIISDAVVPYTKKNTVRFHTIPAHKPYKFYHIAYVQHKKQKNQEAPSKGSWRITEQHISKKRKIPDNAIIIHYPAHLVSSLDGGNSLELPKIILNEEAFQQLSTEERSDALAKSILASLDLNTVHATPGRKLNFAQKTIVSIAT